MSAGPGSGAELLRPDGSVVVPPDVAGDILNALVRDLTASARRDGVQVSDRARRILYALHEAAVRHGEDQAAAASGSGSRPAPSPTVGTALTVAETAALMQCSPRWVRYLAELGRITGRRTGRVWLLDAASVEHYRRHSL